MLPWRFAGTLLSCANTTLPREIKVEVPQGYSGHVRVTLCSVPPKRADEYGNVYVADCFLPSDRIQLTVSRGNMVYAIPPEKLMVTRTGDGIPIVIDVELR